MSSARSNPKTLGEGGWYARQAQARIYYTEASVACRSIADVTATLEVCHDSLLVGRDRRHSTARRSHLLVAS